MFVDSEDDVQEQLTKTMSLIADNGTEKELGGRDGKLS